MLCSSVKTSMLIVLNNEKLSIKIIIHTPFKESFFHLCMFNTFDVILPANQTIDNLNTTHLKAILVKELCFVYHSYTQTLPIFLSIYIKKNTLQHGYTSL